MINEIAHYAIMAAIVAGDIVRVLLRCAIKALSVLAIVFLCTATVSRAWHYRGMTPQAIQAEKAQDQKALQQAERAMEAHHE